MNKPPIHCVCLSLACLARPSQTRPMAASMESRRAYMLYNTVLILHTAVVVVQLIRVLVVVIIVIFDINVVVVNDFDFADIS